MKINYFNARLGDQILPEPALTAWAERHKTKVQLHVNPAYASLFESHPWIEFTEAHSKPDVALNPSLALNFAAHCGLPFGAGYFPQLGLEPRGRFHFQTFGEDLEAFPEREPRVLIVPYARSCGRHQGRRPNIEPDREWWDPILENLPLPAYTLCDSCDEVLPGTLSLQGMPLRQVIWEMRRSAILVSVETGIIHLATTAGIPTVFLSSATPVNLSRPNCRCEVVRAREPNWEQKEVLLSVNRLWREREQTVKSFKTLT